jgi:integral membrane protein
VRRLTGRGLTGALFRYQLMANIVGVLIIPLFIFFFLKLVFGGYKVELAIFGVGHGYLYIVYLITAGFLAFKVRLALPYMLIMFAAGLIPGMTFAVEWWIVTRKIHPILAAEGAESAATAGGSDGPASNEVSPAAQ